MNILQKLSFLVILILSTTSSFAPPRFFDGALENFVDDMASLEISRADAMDEWIDKIQPYLERRFTAEQERIFSRTCEILRAGRPQLRMIPSYPFGNVASLTDKERYDRVLEEIHVALIFSRGALTWQVVEGAVRATDEIATQFSLPLEEAARICFLAQKFRQDPKDLALQHEVVKRAVRRLGDRAKSIVVDDAEVAVSFLEKVLTQNQEAIAARGFKLRISPQDFYEASQLYPRSLREELNDVYRWLSSKRICKRILIGAGISAGLVTVVGVAVVPGEDKEARDFTADEKKLFAFAVDEGKQGLGLSKDGARSIVLASRLWRQPVDHKFIVGMAQAALMATEEKYAGVVPLGIRRKLVLMMLPSFERNPAIQRAVLDGFAVYFSGVRKFAPHLTLVVSAEYAYYYYFYYPKNELPSDFRAVLFDAINLQRTERISTETAVLEVLRKRRRLAD